MYLSTFTSTHYNVTVAINTSTVVFAIHYVMELKKYKGRHALLKSGLNFSGRFLAAEMEYSGIFSPVHTFMFQNLSADYLANPKRRSVLDNVNLTIPRM